MDYSKLVTYLSRTDYRRSLCVKMNEIDDIDHNSEMRKMRLLLESLL